MEPDNQDQKRILMIEDDHFVRDLYSRTLQKKGYDVVTAVDGEDGLNKINSEKFDLILLDVMLPKINGIDLLRKIHSKTETKEIPVFLLTNIGQEAIISEAFKNGAIGYFLKARMLPNDVAKHLGDFFATGEASDQLKHI